VCNEPNGRGATVPIPSQDWQRWRIVWDRTTGDWRSETITWFMNDRQFHQVRGDQINDQTIWASLTAKPLFFILNVAVGGNWVSAPLFTHTAMISVLICDVVQPGYPNDRTIGGYGAMMEVGYVAQYSS
jgi:hypothetical protein